MHKLTLSALLAAAAFLPVQQLSADSGKLPFALKMAREVKAFRGYTKDKKTVPLKLSKHNSQTAGELTIGEVYTAATSVKWPFSKGYQAPGTMLVTVDEKATGPVSSINWRINFNLPNGKNGSAGRKDLKYTTSADWKQNEFEITIPPEAAAMQFVISAVGKAPGKWQMKDITLEYAPDNVTLTEFTPKANQKPSLWKNVQSADCFFDRHTGTAAKVRTSSKVTYDQNNLYIGFICGEPDMSLLKATQTQRDSKVWDDDCVELFVFDPRVNKVKQFIVTPGNVQFDCERRQAQAGDPYRSADWDGKWQSRIWKNKDSWEAVMVIPWKTLEFDSVPQYPLAINIGRERAADKGKYMWNCYQGGFAEVNKFADIDFSKKTLIRSRKVDKINYLPKRARKVYKEVLTDIKKDWKLDMSAHNYHLNYQPAGVRKKHDLQSWKKWQIDYLKLMADAKLFGPVYPWVMHKRNTVITFDEFYDLHKATGITFPTHIDPVPPRAHKLGAMPTFDSPPGRMRVDGSDPATIKSMCQSIDELAEKFNKNPKLKSMISFVEGLDEPCNLIHKMYSRTQNPKMADYLNEFSEKLKAEYGFGKFGMHDQFAPQTADYAFERIAFWRWWNDRYVKHTRTLTAYVKEKLGLETFVLCRNNCGTIDEIDVALLANFDCVAGCDPYPTSAQASFGIARALYHTGFCTKMFRDLAPKATVVSYGQAFNYHGGSPSRADLREWVNQALKTGADYLRWYGSGALQQNPELFNESFEISRQLQTSVPKLKLPTETKTAIYYSDYDRWGLDDRSAHAPYTVYSLLGEHNGFWFRFISKVDFDVKGIKLLYIPRMRFTDPATTAKLVKFVRDGGTIVVLDPDFLRWNIDKTPVPERAELIGTELVSKKLTLPRLNYGKETLGLSKVSHLQLPENGTLHAYDFAKLPAGAKVLATYPDGKPAIIERAVGKGKVIFSAALPFGYPDAALNPGGWKKFTADLGKKVGEKANQDIWFFELPEVKNKYFRMKYPD